MASPLEVSEATFEHDVVARSRETPVVVDFWADWCAPCRALTPILERLADEADGSWVLAAVDVDANPRLSARFGIQGIPAVRAWRDGREVAEFVGALPEPRVREWLGNLGPSPADAAYEEGVRLEHKGDRDGARRAYAEAIAAEFDHGPARAALERIELSERVAQLDEDELHARLGADPEDVDAAIGLADIAAAAGNMGESAEILVNAVRATLGEPRERARVHLLKLLDTLPPDNPIALKARRDLSLALF